MSNNTTKYITMTSSWSTLPKGFGYYKMMLDTYCRKLKENRDHLLICAEIYTPELGRKILTLFNAWSDNYVFFLCNHDDYANTNRMGYAPRKPTDEASPVWDEARFKITETR